MHKPPPAVRGTLRLRHLAALPAHSQARELPDLFVYFGEGGRRFKS